MSRTFLATERALNRTVVVKVLAPELLAGVSVERFKREVMLAASLQHPHVVPVLATGDAQGLPWFTMPFVDGQSLRQRLAAGPIALSEVVQILRDVARGLAFAHGRGVVHRDIKPDNVLLSDGSATVTDFGIAKAITAARTSPSMGLTGTGMSLGTPAYMSPEQAAADPATDHRADLYSYGAMAYEMLTGFPPFAGMSPSRMLAAAMSERPEPLGPKRPDVPAPLAALVMRCLEKQASDRPQQASDIVKVLDTVLSSGAAVSAPAVLQGGRVPVGKALAMWAGATAVVMFVVWSASVSVGLPAWALPGTGAVMALGLPMILLTWYVQRSAYRQFTQTPQVTPGGGMVPQGTLHTMAVKVSPHVSWRRTWIAGAAAVGAFLLAIGSFSVARAYGIGPAGTLIAKGALEQNAKLILADFKSPASDSTLGVTLTEALRADLAQSRQLRVLSRSNVRDVLRLMRRPVDAGVDLALAREVATREGIKAIVDGEIVQLGTGFVVAARLVTTQTGEELGAFRETAANATELLPAVERLSRALRERVGDSFKDIRDATPLERVTTSNVDALKLYVQGMRAAEERRDVPAARQYLEEAIRLDSSFASAYRKLAVTLGNEGSSRSEVQRLMTKAYELRERLSESERLLTEASYFTDGPRQDLRRAELALQSLVDLDPTFFPALNNLAVLYQRQGRWTEAEPLVRRAIALEPGIVTGYRNMARVFGELGRFREIDSMATIAEQRLGAKNAEPLLDRIAGAAMVGDFATAERNIQRVYNEMGTVSQAVGSAAFVHGAILEARGRLKASRAAYARSDSTRKTLGLSVRPLDAALSDALMVARQLGDVPRGRAMALAALKAYPPERVPTEDRDYFGWIEALDVLGLQEQARPLVAALEERVAKANRRDDAVALAFHRAQVLTAKSPSEGVAAWTAIVRDYPEQGIGTVGPFLANAYLALGQPDSALAVTEQFIAHTGWVKARYAIGPYLAKGHQLAGELNERKGNKEKALQHYEKFVELYKDADPELQPVVKDVRARIERLRAATFKG